MVQLKIGSTADLSVFDASHPFDFAVLAGKDDAPYIAMEHRLSEMTPALTSMENSTSVEAGQAVLGFFEEQFSRALVIQRQDSRGNPLLWFNDYGNTASTPIKDIRPLPHEFTSLPSRVIPCALHGIAPKGGASEWSAELVDLFKQLLLKQLKITVRDKRSDQGNVLLKHLVDINVEGEDIGRVFVEAGYAESTKSAPTASALLLKALEKVKPPEKEVVKSQVIPEMKDSLNVGTTISATIVYHQEPGIFFVWQVSAEHIEQVAVVNEKMNLEYAGSAPDPNYAPKKGDYVAAWVVTDGQWCRAKVLGAKDDQDLISISYLEYGETASLSPAQLRPLRNLYDVLPALAIPCISTPKLYPSSADGKWSQAATQFIDKNFPTFDSVQVSSMIRGTLNG
jgi:hypothetical protein